MTALAAVHPQPPHLGRSAALMLLSCAVHGLLLWSLVQYSLRASAPIALPTTHQPIAIQVVVITAPPVVPSTSPHSLLSPVQPAALAPQRPAPLAVSVAPVAEAAAQAPSTSPVQTTAAPQAAQTVAVAAPMGTEKPHAAPSEKPAEAPLVQGHPDYAYNPPPDYPMALREQGLGGVVWLRVWVDSEGHPGEIKLAKGSGYHLLDDAALRAVRTWRFVPARMGEQRQSSWVEFPIRFTANG